MADKLLALVGPGKGPRLCTRRMGKLKVRHSGLNQGVVKIYHEGQEAPIESTQTGVVEVILPRSEWVEIEYDGKGRTFLATVQSAH